MNEAAMNEAAMNEAQTMARFWVYYSIILDSTPILSTPQNNPIEDKYIPEI